MRAPTQREREEFRDYCRSVTDRQLVAVYEKERAANRRVYAQIAKDEAERRQISVTG